MATGEFFDRPISQIHYETLYDVWTEERILETEPIKKYTKKELNEL